MAKKLGLSDEQNKQKQMDLEEEKEGKFVRVDVDTQQAK